MIARRAPLRRKTPLKRSTVALKRCAIRRVSKKRRVQQIIYSDRRRWFLAQPENQICPVMAEKFDEKRRTSQIHHRKGRLSGNYLDESTWMAVSMEGHAYIHAHPAESYEREWMLKR